PGDVAHAPLRAGFLRPGPLAARSADGNARNHPALSHCSSADILTATPDGSTATQPPSRGSTSCPCFLRLAAADSATCGEAATICHSSSLASCGPASVAPRAQVLRPTW